MNQFQPRSRWVDVVISLFVAAVVLQILVVELRILAPYLIIGGVVYLGAMAIYRRNSRW